MARKNAKERMMTYLSKAQHYKAGAEYEKAIEYYEKAIEIDEPLARELGIDGDLDRVKTLLKEQNEEPIRGLGILYLDVLNTVNQYINIHRVFITEAVKDDMRLPVIARTRFVKAKSIEELEEGVAVALAVTEAEKDEWKKDSEDKIKKFATENTELIKDAIGLNKKITALEKQKDEVGKSIKAHAEKLLGAENALKKSEKTAMDQSKTIDDLKSQIRGFSSGAGELKIKNKELTEQNKNLQKALKASEEKKEQL